MNQAFLYDAAGSGNQDTARDVELSLPVDHVRLAAGV
jgi:hypothetical protein